MAKGLQRMEHVGVVVDDIEAATAFFVALGLDVDGRTSVEGPLVDRINGLDGVTADIVILTTGDASSKLELARYRTPAYTGGDAAAPPPNAPGIRHLLFAVDDIEASLAAAREHGAELVGELVNYEDMYKLCYLRGPAGIIVELAEKIG